jgi:hypothetical protein
VIDQPHRSASRTGEASRDEARDPSAPEGIRMIDAETPTDAVNGGTPRNGKNCTLTTRSGKRRTFSLHDWRQRTEGLPVLHDGATASQPPFDSDDDRYLAFRQFLYDSGTHPPRWEDHYRGFPFVRKEARELQERVFEALEDSSLKPDPLLR